MADPLQVETRDRASIFNAVLGKWSDAWQTVFRPFARYAAINISFAGSHTIVSGRPGEIIKIASIFFTVFAEVNVTLYDGSIPISGPMDFGLSGEPRGIVIPFAYSPLELTVGNAFIINLSAISQVSGTVVYMYQ